MSKRRIFFSLAIPLNLALWMGVFAWANFPEHGIPLWIQIAISGCCFAFMLPGSMILIEGALPD